MATNEVYKDGKPYVTTTLFYDGKDFGRREVNYVDPVTLQALLSRGFHFMTISLIPSVRVEKPMFELGYRGKIPVKSVTMLPSTGVVISPDAGVSRGVKQAYLNSSFDNGRLTEEQLNTLKTTGELPVEPFIECARAAIGKDATVLHEHMQALVFTRGVNGTQESVMLLAGPNVLVGEDFQPVQMDIPSGHKRSSVEKI